MKSVSRVMYWYPGLRCSYQSPLFHLYSGLPLRDYVQLVLAPTPGKWPAYRQAVGDIQLVMASLLRDDR